MLPAFTWRHLITVQTAIKLSMLDTVYIKSCKTHTELEFNKTKNLRIIISTQIMMLNHILPVVHFFEMGRKSGTHPTPIKKPPHEIAKHLPATSYYARYLFDDVVIDF
jgi:hypothetical protein